MRKYLIGLILLTSLTGCKIENQKETILIDSPNFGPRSDQEDEAGFQPRVKGGEWFEMAAINFQHWEIEAEDKIDRLTNQPIEIESRKENTPNFNIVAIFSKQSSAYDTALNSILTLFAGREISAEILVVNGENNPEKIDFAYSYAKATGPDLIFSFGSKATAILHNQAGSIPVVSVTSKDPVLLGQLPDYSSGSGTHIAYTSLNVPIDLQLSYLKKFRPELSTIGVFYAENNRSAVVTQVDPLILAAEAEGIEIIRFNVKDQHNAKAELEVMMPFFIKQMRTNDPENKETLLWITGSTSVFSEIETINRLASDIPVLSVITNVTREGDESAMLSIGVSFESNALMAAVYALRILDGDSAGDLPVGVVSPPDISINFAKAQQSETKIPFSFFESANFIYNTKGQTVRTYGQ